MMTLNCFVVKSINIWFKSLRHGATTADDGPLLLTCLVSFEDQNIAPHISSGMSFYSVRLVVQLLYKIFSQLLLPRFVICVLVGLSKEKLCFRRRLEQCDKERILQPSGTVLMYSLLKE